ncbi:hypothetical protein DF107_18015 [Burkholderia stagnalis]|uniref:hypothetical protein n=1 Tax=Burkholderia stagnalis TaxID=1503054 RepID=UPI000F5B45D3|nr:hypothetical protein [Burkholderia stagnalis]RQQ19701.1 hypothetical protein DF161_06945 [Burkholderia stagnalis]RQY67249.1 hypothetical protein DF109_07830 [Burkholderia stagnalis]RQY80014.1 hypothetical protein DF107_18015 [Burkholderia stagnalis]
MKRLFLISAAVLAGCAASSGVVSQGDGTFFISKQAATGFSGLGNLKAEVIGEARDYCARTGNAVQIIKIDEARPPFILGNYPRAEATFRCTST